MVTKNTPVFTGVFLFLLYRKNFNFNSSISTLNSDEELLFNLKLSIMNDQELLLKTNDELTEIVNDLMSKIKHLMETDKTSPRRSEYFEDLQTVMGILKRRQG